MTIEMCYKFLAVQICTTLLEKSVPLTWTDNIQWNDSYWLTPIQEIHKWSPFEWPAGHAQILSHDQMMYVVPRKCGWEMETLSLLRVAKTINK